MASALERYREWQREGVSGKVSQADTASKLQDSARAAGRSALERYRLWETTRPYDQSDFQSYLDRRDEMVRELGRAYSNTERYQSPQQIDATASRIRSQYADAFSGQEAALSWVKSNADNYSWDDYVALRDYVSGANDELDKLIEDITGNAREYWGQFESEDAYKDALAQQAEYERLLNLDTQALEAEIARKESEAQSEAVEMVDGKPVMRVKTLEEYLGLRDDAAQSADESKSELAQMRLDLRNAQSVQDVARYEQMARQIPGFGRSAQEAMDLQNPTWQEYLGWLQFGNARLGGQEPANLATFARDNRKWLQASQSDAALNPLGNDAVAASYMYDDEVEIYSGLLAREGKEVADAYLAALRPKLSAREGESIANEASDSMLKQGIYGLSGSFLESMRALGQLAQPDAPMPVSATEYALSAIGENLDETGWRVGDWNLGRATYDLATNLGGNVAPMAIGNLIAPGAGAVAMGVVSGAGALRDAMRQGYSYGEALPYAAMSGLSEAGMGYLLGGIRQLGGVGTRHVAQRLIGKVGNRFARAGLNWGLNALGEFSEETIQSALDPVLRNWLLDENNEIKLYDEQYLYEGLLGALTSVLLGVGEFRQSLRVQDFGTGVMESGNAQALIEHAQQMGDSSEAARLAREMQSGVMPTNAQSVGELAVAYANEGGDVSFMQPQPDPNAVAVGEMGDDVLSQLYAQADEAAQTPEEADAWRRAVDLAYEAGRRGMPEDELDRFDLSNVESQEEARRAEAPRTAQSAPQGRNTAQAKRRAVRSAYYAGRADAQSEQAAREAVYEEGNTEAAAQPVQADVAQAQATDAAVPTAVQTDVAAQTAAQASQADARMQGGAPKGSPWAKGELSAKLTEGSSSRAARKRLPDWTNTRGGLVRQDSAGENLNRQQMAHLRVLEALGRKYNVVFVTRDSISVESSAAEARRAEVASTRSAQPRNTAQANAQGGANAEARRAEVASTRSAQPRNTAQALAQGGAKEGNRANARYDGGRVFEVALDAQEGAYTYFATHEMAHYLKSQSADMYAALADSVRAWADGAGIDFDARVQAAQERYARAGQELTQEQAAEEVVGDMLGTIFADPSAAQELLNNAPRSVLEKIRDFISELLDTISAAARRITGAKDLTALTELEGWAQDMAKMLDAAMSETGRRTAERMHEAPSTGIEIGNMARYSLKMQNTIREYLDSVDEEFLSYMERFREGKLAGYMKPVLFADVPQRLASEIADLLGMDVSGYKMGFQRDFLEHVEKRHGEHGKSDQSMRDANDFARLPYILETYDAISRPINENGSYVLSSKYKNSDGSLAPILLVEKRINGTYYSALAVPNSARKTIWLVSAYIGPKKEGRSRVPDAMPKHAPLATSKNEHESGPSIPIITDSGVDSNTDREISSGDSLRYSLFDETADASQLLSENERLRRLHETFASKVGDVSRYKGKITQEAALTAARGIKRATQSKIDADALAGSLTALREEANRQGEAGRADNEFLVQLAQNIARQVLEQSAFVDESARTLDQALRRHLRGTRLSLSDAQKAEARKVLGDSRAFARANMGRFVVANDGMPLSSLWNELSTMFPSLFDETTSEGDMPIALMDAFERARPEIENPYGSNEEYLMYVSYDILNRVLGLPEAKTYLEAARAEGERRGQRVGRREARAQTAQAVREARQAGRAQVQEVRAQERARADERVRAAREAAAKRAERRAETEAKARLRRSIARKANNLIARLAKPTDARHIPEAMRKSVFEALRRINYTAEAPSIRHEAWQARIANLSNQINRYQDTLAEGGMDPALVADLNALVDEIDSTTRFDDMTSKQLEVLDDVFANLTRLVNEQDRLVSTRNRERAQAVADSAIQFLAGRRERRSDRTARAVDLVTFDAMAAGDFFRTQLGEDAGGTLYQALRDGQDSTHAHMAQAAQDFAAMLKRRGIAYKDRQDWEKQIKAVKLSSGETIYARDTQLMTIYALSGREAGRRHLLSERGGIVLGRVRGTVDGRRINATQARPTRLTAEDLSTIADALSPKQRGIVDDMVEYMSSTISDWGNHASMEMYGYRKFTEDHYWPVQVDRTAVRLTNLLDENSVKMNAAKHRGFTKALNEQAANPVDIGDAFQIFGAHAVEMANYDGYAPVVDDLIKVFNSVSVPPSPTSPAPSPLAARGYGPAYFRASPSKLPGPSRPLASRTAARDSGAAERSALSSPLHPSGSTNAGTSLRTELSRTTGQAGEHYVRKLLEDINHASTMTSAAEGLVGTLVANYKKSAILAKPRVAVQQYTAIARALDEINANYLARGVAESAKRRGASVREMQEHAPIAWWKSHGNYDTHVGQSAINIVLGDESVRTRIDEASMALAGKADNAAWAGIWEAVKLEVAAGTSVRNQRVLERGAHEIQRSGGSHAGGGHGAPPRADVQEPRHGVRIYCVYERAHAHLQHDARGRHEHLPFRRQGPRSLPARGAHTWRADHQRDVPRVGAGGVRHVAVSRRRGRNFWHAVLGKFQCGPESVWHDSGDFGLCGFVCYTN